MDVNKIVKEMKKNGLLKTPKQILNLRPFTVMINASSSSVKFFIKDLQEKRNERNHGTLHERKVRRSWNPVGIIFTPVLTMDGKFQQYDVEVVK